MRRSRRAFAAAALAGGVAAVVLIAACGVRDDAPKAAAPVGGAGGAAFGLPPPLPAADSAARIELGRQLFLDRRLSFNGTMSCGMCHVPEEGFASNASRLAVGIEGRSLRRNAPTVLNVAWVRELFLDGREPLLEAQAWSPLLHPHEMANPSAGHVVARVRSLADYAGRFEQAFDGRPASMDTIGAALAAYQRTLVAGDSRFDRWRYGGEAEALTPLERRGFELFIGRARCASCHTVGERDAMFTDQRFHATGAGFVPRPERLVVPLAPGVQTQLDASALDAFAAANVPDLGRFEVTLDAADRYAFRTPGLRNVARTAPYMHDGSLATIEEVVDFYDRGGGDLPDKSALLAPLGLSVDDKRALAAFLRALDSSALPALVAAARAPLPAEPAAR